MDKDVFQLLRLLWENHKILIFLVGGYGLACFAIWIYLRITLRDGAIDALQPVMRDVRSLLRLLRDWIMSGLSGGWAALTISVIVMIISLPFQRLGSTANSGIVQLVSFMPGVVIALIQIRSHYNGVLELRRYINGDT